MSAPINTGRRLWRNYITLEDLEAYSGDDYCRPDDRSVQEAVERLISAHEEEFQELLNAAEIKTVEQYAMGG